MQYSADDPGVTFLAFLLLRRNDPLRDRVRGRHL